MRKIKNFVIGLVLMLFSTFIVLATAEIALRIWGNQSLYTVSQYPKKLFDLNSSTGLRPGFQGSFKKSEIHGKITINSKGLRDYERSYEKKGKFRILALGDSFTFGHGVEFEESFPNILEKELQSKIQRNIQVIKFGNPNAGSKDYLMYLKNEGQKYNPDIVMVFFFVGNDIWQDTAIAVRRNGIADNKLVPIHDFKNWLRLNIHLYSFAVDRLKHNPTTRKWIFDFGIAHGIPESFYIKIFKKNYPDNWKMAWKETQTRLKEIKNNSQDMILVILPSREQIYSDRLATAIEQLGFQKKDLDIYKPNQLLIQFSNEEQINYIDLTPQFKDVYETISNPLYFNIDPHFNPAGHRLASQVIFPELKKILTGKISQAKLQEIEID